MEIIIAFKIHGGTSLFNRFSAHAVSFQLFSRLFCMKPRKAVNATQVTNRVKPNLITRNFLLGCLLSLTTFFMISCNEKSKEDEEVYVVPSSVAVTSFKIKQDASVMNNLDSVFFSIDLNRGVIFNADSLPKGTDVSNLCVSIAYAEAVESAVITLPDKEINYKTNPSDSIDFTKRVILTLKADNGKVSRDYLIKVNVHQANPDSLMWDRLAVSKLPSRHTAPRNQKTVTQGEKALCLIEENDGSHTLAVTSNPAAADWSRNEIALPFTPDIRSFAATTKSLYLLDDSGELYESADGTSWTSCATTWECITGSYGDRLLGLRIQDGIRLHCSWPRTTAESEAEADFPVEDASNLGLIYTKWADNPTAIIVGGRTAAGETLNSTWAYDGNSWARISLKGLPAVTGASLVPYFAYRRTAVTWIQTEFSVWLLLGGRLADGSPNRDAYISYDGGINWTKGRSMLQLPEFIPQLTQADNIVMTTPKSADLSDAWEGAPTRKVPTTMRIKYDIDGYDINWECPYIYLIGGFTPEGILSDEIWRGVLARLTFAPLI